jgi:hypothetical protein
MPDKRRTERDAIAVAGRSVLPMTDFDLRALGWVVTRDLFWEIARSLAGRTRLVPLTAMERLNERWQAVQTAAAKTSDPLLTRFVSSPLLRSMSAETRAAAAEYLIVLSTACPDLYSLQVIDERCRRAGARAIAGVGGSIVFGSLADLSYPLIADAAVVLFAMGAWNLITLLQLRSVRKLLAGLACRGSHSEARGLSS